MTKIDTSAQNDKPKEKYKVKNWSEYNNGLIKRGSLTLWLSEETISTWHHKGPKKKGGQYAYSSGCILSLLSLKVVFGLTFRQLEGFAAKRAVLNKYIHLAKPQPVKAA